MSNTPRTRFAVVGKTPTREEMERLVNIPNPKKAITSQEVATIVKNIVIFFAIGVIARFLGSIMLGDRTGASVSSLGSLMGFLFLLALKWALPIGFFVAIIFQITSFFETAQKKTIDDALKYMFLRAIFSNEKSGFNGIENFGSVDFATTKYLRMLPDALNISSAAVTKYIGDFREKVQQAVAPYQKTEVASPRTSLENVSCTKVAAGVEAAKAQLTFQANVSVKKGNSTTSVCVAEVVMDISLVMVKAGEYWFPYDVFPEVTAAENK